MPLKNPFRTNSVQPDGVVAVSEEQLGAPKTTKLMFVAVFALIGASAAVYSFALTPGNGDFEAETMAVQTYSTTTKAPLTVKTEGESFPQPANSGLSSPAVASASGGKVLQMNRNSKVTQSVTTTVATTAVSINAMSTTCGNSYGSVTLKIDGTVIVTSVATAAYADYSATTDIPAGVHAIEVDFTNDLYRAGYCDRNLFVDSISMTGTKVTQKYVTPATKVVDTTASGGKYLKFSSNGKATISVNTPGVNKISVQAKGTNCLGDPTMIVTIGGSTVMNTAVTSDAFKAYTATINLPAASHFVEISFPNDAYTAGTCDRNLLVDKVEFNPVPVASVPTVPATPTPPANPLTTNPYASNDVWYNPLPATTPLDSNSANIVANIQAQSKTYYNTFGINTSNYSPPFFIADKTTPTVTVGFNDCQKKGYTPTDFTSQLTAVPIPAGAAPAGGTDSEMVVYQPSTHTMWEMWKTNHDATTGAWTACWGGRMTNMDTNRGIFTNPYGTTATSLPFLGSTIMADELASGNIDHALGFAVVNARKSTQSWPASRNDGNSADVNTPIEGQRFRLDSSVNVDALNMTPAGKTIAKAIQKYGMVLRDKSGNVTLYAQNATTFTATGQPNPYTDIFKGVPSYSIMNGFPWDKLQALPKDYGK